jgi:mannose-6-phosphate isomerase-like protein (cupin superfamily)
MKPKFKKLEIKKIDTPKMTMSPMELREYIDFDVKRVYFITNLKDGIGKHCHHEEKELFVMVQGSCVATIDEGRGFQKIKMEAPSDTIYVGNYVWHQFDEFSDDAILLALSSTNYSSDRADYIEDYKEYQKFLSERGI